MNKGIKTVNNGRCIVCIFLIVAVSFLSCKKQTVYTGHPVVMTVFNGLDNGVTLYGNYSGSHPIMYIMAQELISRSVRTVSFEAPDIRARYFASPDTLPKDLPVFDKELELENGKSYSIYLAGDRSSVDHLLLENNFKGYKPGDSVTYIQLVNISNDQPVSVNIKGMANGSLINKLAYKEGTDFIELKADGARSSYEFEFRDASTGELLASNTVQEINGAPGSKNRYLYKNWTLVFTGKRGAAGANAIRVTKIHHQ